MSKSLKIILWIVGSFISLLVVFILIGTFSSKTYHGSATVRLKAPIDKVWEVLTDVENVPKRRPEVKRVEITGINDQGYKMWREYTDMGGFIDFEIVEHISQEKMVVRMNRSSFGMTGQWVYEAAYVQDFYTAQGGESQTELTITEDSTTNNIFVRTLMILVGRDKNIRTEFETLKKVL